ncbi:uncharacterized protein HHUB_2447 [Halobacterium hubeiense]|uniref:Uncharacterized protein n=1 Tax=Halobacterium hubeiense TaxID=1407499 RepID=A0A0U5H251_9EURY|nr:uncharacterized protein HHUB_2447 [Halobacterium hubeiense]
MPAPAGRRDGYPSGIAVLAESNRQRLSEGRAERFSRRSRSIIIYQLVRGVRSRRTE